MRLAVFGDIHGNLPALEAALADIKRAGDFDLVWCLGDLAALGGQPRQCIERLQALQAGLGEDKFKIIGGNTDRYLVTGERFPMTPPAEEAGYAAYRDNILDMSAVLEWNLKQLTWDDFQLLSKILGRELRHKVAGYGSVIAFHAIPGADEPMSLRPDSSEEEAADALLDRQGRLALCGHTHLVLDRQVGHWRVINPGSIGLSASNPGQAEWALLEWREGSLAAQLRAVPYDVQATLREWDALGHPRLDWMCRRMGV